MTKKAKKILIVCLALGALAFLFGASVTAGFFNIIDELMAMRFAWITFAVCAIAIVCGIWGEGTTSKVLGTVGLISMFGALYPAEIAKFFGEIQGKPFMYGLAGVLIIAIIAVAIWDEGAEKK